jgi:hypothetical protein
MDSGGSINILFWGETGFLGWESSWIEWSFSQKRDYCCRNKIRRRGNEIHLGDTELEIPRRHQGS